MKCPKCKTENKTNAKFCRHCGDEFRLNESNSDEIKGNNKKLIRNNKKLKLHIKKIKTNIDHKLFKNKKYRKHIITFLMLAFVLIIAILGSTIYNNMMNNDQSLHKDQPIFYLTQAKELKVIDKNDNHVIIDQNVTPESIYKTTSLSQDHIYITSTGGTNLFKDSKELQKLGQEQFENVVTSKNGEYILYTITTQDKKTLYHLNIETGVKNKITDHSGENYAISPNGKYIFYYDTVTNSAYKKVFDKKASDILGENIIPVTISDNGSILSYFSANGYHIKDGKKDPYYISDKTEIIITDKDNKNFIIGTNGDIFIKKYKKIPVRTEGNTSSIKDASDITYFVEQANFTSKKTVLYSTLYKLNSELTYCYLGNVYHFNGRSATLVKSIDAKQFVFSNDHKTAFYIDHADNLNSVTIRNGKVSKSYRLKAGVKEIIEVAGEKVCYKNSDNTISISKHKSSKPYKYIPKIKDMEFSSNGNYALVISDEDILYKMKLGKKPQQIAGGVTSIYTKNSDKDLNTFYFIMSETLCLYQDKKSQPISESVLQFAD